MELIKLSREVAGKFDITAAMNVDPSKSSALSASDRKSICNIQKLPRYMTNIVTMSLYEKTENNDTGGI